MKKVNLLILFSIFLSIPLVTQAATGLFENLTALNRIHPLQRPDYDKSSQILGRRVLDRKNKVIGDVDDVILNNNGNISSLNVEFNRIGLKTPVYINYNALKAEPVTNGYMVGFESSEVQTMFPTLLSNVQTAAGGQGNETYALSKLIGTEVRTEEGNRIGKITDVLFGARGDRAEVFYISMEPGKARGKAIAVPFNVPQISSDGGRFKAIVTKEQADIMTKFAADQR